MKLRYTLTVLPVLLCGCSLISSNDSADAPVRLRDRLEVPPDLSRTGTDDLSSLPTVSASTAKAAAAPAAVTASSPPVVGPPANSQARLEREGNQRWLVVNGEPDQVWSVLRDYLKRTTGDLAAENAKTGYLETDWVEQRPNLGKSALGKIVSKMQSTGLRDKFRVRVEYGRVTGTTEVMVSHIGLEEVVIGTMYTGATTTWQPRKSDPVLEADLLDRMLTTLGAVDPTTRPVLTTEQPAVKRAARPKGPLVLAGETSDSAWRRVSQALDRAGVTIEDRDRGAGLLYVRFVEQSAGKDAGFLSRLFGSSKASTTAEAEQDRFQLRLRTDKNGVLVEVLDVKGEVDKSDIANRLLDVLYQQLF